jgi:hypothetical protein
MACRTAGRTISDFVLSSSNLPRNDLAWRFADAQQVRRSTDVGKEEAMAIAGNLLNKFWLWLRIWLRVSLYWFSNLTLAASIRLRRWLLKVREKKSILKMGRRVFELHQKGQNDWSEDSEIKAILQVLEEKSRKKEELRTRMQERKGRYREKVQKLRVKESKE